MNHMSLKDYRKKIEEEDPKRYAEVVQRVRLEQQIYEEMIELRKAENLTQQELADRLEVSQAVIGKFESGKTKNPSITFLEKVFDALGYKMTICIEKK